MECVLPNNLRAGKSGLSCMKSRFFSYHPGLFFYEYNKRMAEKVSSLADIRTRIELIQSKLDEFGVQSIAIFGSFSRNEMTDKSDVDILVEFRRSIGLFEFARLKIYLSEIMGREVDLVTVDALHKRMKSTILNEAVYVATGLAK
jgi:uncharacterized protein